MASGTGWRDSLKSAGRWLRADEPAVEPQQATVQKYTSDWFSGNIYLFERNLAHLAGKPCQLLEIGSFEGRSAIWLLNNIATHEEARIFCIDASPQPALSENLALERDRAKITLMLGPSGDLLPTLPKGCFDFIYVDGSHKKLDVLEDAVMSFRLAKSGAVIAFDDYTEDGPDWNPRDFAKPAIDAFLEVCGEEVTVLERCHQIWISKNR